MLNKKYKILPPDLADIFNTQVFLNGSLIAAEHGEPVESAANHDGPKIVTLGWVRVHVENFDSTGFEVILPNFVYSTGPGHAKSQNEKQRAQQNCGLEGIGHDDCLHTTLNMENK